jgi:hypothetical protein
MTISSADVASIIHAYVLLRLPEDSWSTDNCQSLTGTELFFSLFEQKGVDCQIFLSVYNNSLNYTVIKIFHD